MSEPLGPPLVRLHPTDLARLATALDTWNTRQHAARNAYRVTACRTCGQQTGGPLSAYYCADHDRRQR